MQIDLDLVIDTPKDVHEVDMKTGLHTMQGISDTVRTITETVLLGDIPEKKTINNPVRTSMKNTFEGSYGLKFSLDMHGKAKEQSQLIGKSVIVELIEFYLDEALDRTPKNLSTKADDINKKLGEKSLELISVLRRTMLKDSHKALQNFGYITKLRYGKKRMRELQTFDYTSYDSLVAKQNNKIQTLNVTITRFNRFTGNGRLQVEGVKETHAFGFFGYATVANFLRKKIANNLYENTGISEDQNMSYLTIECYSFERRDGKVIKYMITKVL